MKEETLNQLLSFEADHVWINDNWATLLNHYSDQWIAVENGNIIASAIDLDALLAKLPNPEQVCIEFITREPLEMVL